MAQDRVRTYAWNPGSTTRAARISPTVTRRLIAAQTSGIQNDVRFCRIRGTLKPIASTRHSTFARLTASPAAPAASVLV